MKIVILCGGQGTRIREESEFKPKPMIQIGEMPILWHIMKHYAHHGLNEFIVCLGYKGSVIKDYFYHYEVLSNDFTIELGTREMQIHPRHAEHGWKITLVETGINSMTGSRVKQIEKYIDGDRFMLTYGDAVTNLNIKQLLEYHISHGKIGTVTGVCPPSRYGELVLSESRVVSFKEKPETNENLINGGYFIFERKFFDYLEDNIKSILERAPLEKLANDGQLQVYHHRDFWQCMDTYRDYKYLNDLWEKGNPPWQVW